MKSQLKNLYLNLTIILKIAIIIINSFNADKHKIICLFK
jgi:hypothetical protein